MPLILITIGLVLIIYNYRAIIKENRIEKEEDILNISFQSVLQDNKEELNDYKMEIGLLRKDVAESLTELQEEIVDIKNNLNRLKNNKEIYENKEDLENKYSLNENYIDSNTNKEYNKINDKKIQQISPIDEIINGIDENLFVDSNITEGIISEIDFSENVDSSKTQNIKRLLNKGLTEEQICHELSVSKGEVLLVKGLFKKIKKKISFLIDKKILFGLGLGLVLGVICMFGYKYTSSISDSQIEEKARDLGMIYESESKAILKGED